MRKKYLKLLKLIIKIIVAGAAMYWVFSKINIADILTLINNASISFLIIAMLFFALSKIIAALRLNIIFYQSGIYIEDLTNIKLYWLGMFYNLFLPGGIGGDGYKIYLVNKTFNKPFKLTFGAVLTDRLSGVLALSVLACILFSISEKIIPYQVWFFVGAILLALGFWIFLKLFYKKYIPVYTQIFIYSLGVQIMQLFSVYFILNALGYNGFILPYLVLFLISSFVSILPISIGGIGLREMTFFLGAGYFYLQPDISLSLSLLFYIISLFTSFAGIIWVIKPLKLNSEFYSYLRT